MDAKSFMELNPDYCKAIKKAGFDPLSHIEGERRGFEVAINTAYGEITAVANHMETQADKERITWLASQVLKYLGQ